MVLLSNIQTLFTFHQLSQYCPLEEGKEKQGHVLQSIAMSL